MTRDSEYSIPSFMDEAQQRAVCKASGNCEIIAGPGSGKTSVLIEHIRFLIHVRKIPPEQILVLTFSREAARHLKERFREHLSESGNRVVFGTFHSVFYHILKQHSGIAYRLIDDAARHRLIVHLSEEFGSSPDPWIRAEEVEKRLAGHDQNDPVVKLYNRYLQENALVDYDRILAEAYRFLTSGSEAAEKTACHYRHVLIDEFQDINPEQYQIVQAVSKRADLYAVGDDDQTIYGFRGSDPAIMARFMSDYPDAERIFLETNYRCGHHIVAASSLQIAQNRIRAAKKLRAAHRGGDRVSLLSFCSGKEQDDYLISALDPGTGSTSRSIAVICRTNRQVQHYARLLTASGTAVFLPAGAAGSTTGQCREILADIEAYSGLAQGMRFGEIRRENFYRVMNRPERCLLRTVMRRDEETPAELVRNTADQQALMGPLLELLDDCTVLGSLMPKEFLCYLFDSMGYREYCLRKWKDQEQTQMILDRIVQIAAACREMQALLQNTAVLMDVHSRKDMPEPGEGKNGIRILTMHASKGLEFDSVYIPDLNEGIIPSRRSKTEAEIEEERRLLYVAMTRAKSRLELLYIKGTRENPRPPSRFLKIYGVKSFV